MEVARNDKSFSFCYVDPNPMDFQAFFGSLWIVETGLTQDSQNKNLKSPYS